MNIQFQLFHLFIAGNLMENNSQDLTFLESFNMRSKYSNQDCQHLPAQKVSIEFPSVPENRLHMHLNDSSGCDDVTVRRLQLRNNHYSTPGKNSSNF